jgi:hypothetical protein
VPVAVVAEYACADAHLMVAAYIDPSRVMALRGQVAAPVGADGLWCGPAAASPQCRDGLVTVVNSGGVGAVVVEAAAFHDPGQARAACLRAVVTDADDAAVDQLLVARDDTHAAYDTTGAAALARAAGATPHSCPTGAVATLSPWQRGHPLHRRIRYASRGPRGVAAAFAQHLQLQRQVLGLLRTRGARQFLRARHSARS